MAAYVIVDIRIRDRERYERYKKLAGDALKAHGGRFLARGGRTETWEGGWSPERIVVLEFDSAEAARRWYDSEEYREAKALRQATAESRMILVEGA